MSRVRDLDVRCFARQHSIPVDALMLKYKNHREALLEMMELVEKADSFKESMLRLYSVPSRYASTVYNETGLSIEEAILALDDSGFTVKQVQEMTMLDFVSAVKSATGSGLAEYEKAFSYMDNAFVDEDDSFLDEDDFVEEQTDKAGSYEFGEGWRSSNEVE